MFLKFEDEVMLKIIYEDCSYKEKLIEQYNTAKVISRSFTGHGFFTNYSIPDGRFSLGKNISLTLGNVGANVNDMKHGAGFALFVKNGLISFLEGFAYDEYFPKEILKYELF